MQALPYNNPPARPAEPGWRLTGCHTRAGWCRCLGMAVGGWLVFSLPLPAASPILEINRPSPNAVRLAWPAAERNWVVEGGTDLARMVTVLSAPRIEGDRIALTLPATEPAFFWRLRSQVTAGAAGGRNFLRDSQNDAGQWGVAGQASVLYSAGALEALHQLGWADPSFDGVVGFGLDALGYAVTRNNDELSRKIIALATGGRPVTSLVDELLGAQNPELPEATSLAYPGLAWGAAPALGGTVIDTALALRALEAARALGAGLGLSVVREAVPAGATSAGYLFAVPAGATAMDLHIRSLSGNARFDFLRPDSSTSYFNATPGGVPVHVNFGNPPSGNWTMTVVNNAGAPIVYSAEVTFTTAEGTDISRLTGAVSYLGLAQNADGGWGMSAGMDSQLMITCEAMTALAGRGAWADSALAAAANWLNGKRNADGGFSSEPGASNTVETALAVLAIGLSGQPISLATARDFLRSEQLLNGSWQEDPYVTALAARALAQPPVLATIPGQNVVIPAQFAPISLDDFVTDPDHPDSQITWSVSGQSQLAVSITDRVATISYPPDTEVAETLTFTATDPDGLSSSTTATFRSSLTPPFDYSIARGGSVTGTRSFTTTPENFARIASFSLMVTGLAPGVSYTTLGAWLVAPDTIEIDYRISVGTEAATGMEDFSVEYRIKDAGGNVLSPVFDNTFNFTIQITP